MKKNFSHDRAWNYASYIMKSSALFSACFLFLALPVKAWTFLEALGFKEPEDYVEFSVNFDPNCSDDPDYVLRISITNNYNRAIDHTRFMVVGRKSGYSSEIYSGELSTDRIIHPSETYTSSCWKIPNYYRNLDRIERRSGRYPFDQMEWSGEVVSVRVSE